VPIQRDEKLLARDARGPDDGTTLLHHRSTSAGTARPALSLPRNKKPATGWWSRALEVRDFAE